MRLTTFDDLISHTITYLGKDASRATAADAKEAVIDAYLELGSSHPWNYYKRILRVTTVQPYATGTVAYDHEGGAFPRLLTLTGGVWPNWATSGTVVIGGVTYEVRERRSNTLLTLTESSNPGADVASTSYKIYRDQYPLPSDFLSVIEGAFSDGLSGPSHMSPQEYMRCRARTGTGPAKPVFYTVIGDPNLYSGMAACFWPAPDVVYPLDVLYRARGRDLIVDQYTEGTVSTTSGSDVITGSGTVFTSEMEGAVIRLGSTSDPRVTGNEGLSRYRFERTILEVVSGTSLRVDSALDATLSGVSHIISDPIDVEPNAMLRALKRECDRQARLKTRMQPIRGEEEAWTSAMRLAMAADARFTGLKVAGAPYLRQRRLREYPVDLSLE